MHPEGNQNLLSKITRKFKEVRSGHIVRRTSLISSAETIRLALQAVFFFVLAGALGVKGIGQYAGTAALVGLVQPLASWGSTDLLLKHVSRDHSLIRQWIGTSITITVLISSLLAALLILTAPLILGSAYDWRILVPLLITDMLALRVVELSWASFVAMEQIKSVAMVRLIWAATRFVALIAFILVQPDPTPAEWAMVQAAVMMILIICLLWTVYRRFGRPKFSQPFKPMSFSEGFAFAIGTASETVFGDVDKTLLVRMRGEAVAGFYTVAYRLVSFAYVPVSALIMAKLTAMFRAGHGSLRASLDEVRNVRLALGVYLSLTAVALVLIGPLIPMILGEEFAEAGTVLAWLALMPAVTALHRILGAVLMTSGHAKARASALAITAVLNIVLSILLISLYSWQGAVMATYASEILLAAMYAFWIHRQLRIFPVNDKSTDKP